MTQQGGPEDLDRDQAAYALATLSIDDIEFLSGLRTDLESTLWRYGFALSPREKQIVRDSFQYSDLSDEEIVEVLRQGKVDRDRHWPW
jgi:hypothetical protein